MAFIQTFIKDGKNPMIFNTDNITAILKSEAGTELYTVSGLRFDITADYEEVLSIMTAEAKKPQKIETGVLNVKVVNMR